MGLFLGLILTLIALNFLREILNRYIYRYLLLMVRDNRLAMLLFAFLFLPGVALHEASHWIMAKLLWVKTHRFSLIPEWVEDGTIRFGFVEMSRTDRVRSALIALAPLISGVFVILWLALNHLHLDQALIGIRTLDFESFQHGMHVFFRTPDLLLWIYLLFTISNTMLPSPADLKVWLPIGATFVVLYAIVVIISPGSATSAWLINLARWIAETLLQAFIIATILNICFVVPLLLLERLLKRTKKMLPSI
jgi:hypothetical protein